MPFVTASILGGAALSSALIGAHAAGSAADAQVSAADKALAVQQKEAADALAVQKQQNAQNQLNLAPWELGGSSAEANLLNLMGILPKQASSTPIPGTPGGTAAPAAQSVSYPGAKPGNIPQNIWNMMGINQQIALTRPNADVSAGVPVTGKPPDIPQSLWDSMPQAQKDSLLNVGKPYSATSGTVAPGDSLASLVNPSLGAKGSLVAPFSEQFVAPTDVTEKNDPGYQFRLDQGDKGIERSAAAKGGLLSGGTASDLSKFNQDYASNEYGNVYGRAWNEYTNRYNQYENKQTNTYNRLAAIAGLGQTTAQQLSLMGTNSADNISNLMMTSGAQQAQDIQNAGDATASGYIRGANAWTGALGSGTNNLMQLLLLQQMQPPTLESQWGTHPGEGG